MTWSVFKQSELRYIFIALLHMSCWLVRQIPNCCSRSFLYCQGLPSNHQNDPLGIATVWLKRQSLLRKPCRAHNPLAWSGWNGHEIAACWSSCATIMKHNITQSENYVAILRFEIWIKPKPNCFFWLCCCPFLLPQLGAVLFTNGIRCAQQVLHDLVNQHHLIIMAQCVNHIYIIYVPV